MLTKIDIFKFFSLAYFYHQSYKNIAMMKYMVYIYSKVWETESRRRSTTLETNNNILPIYKNPNHFISVMSQSLSNQL